MLCMAAVDTWDGEEGMGKGRKGGEGEKGWGRGGGSEDKEVSRDSGEMTTQTARSIPSVQIRTRACYAYSRQVVM